MMEQNFWTILETYSLVQGFLLAIYSLFFLKRPFLAATLITISILILWHLYYHFEWYYNSPHYIFVEASLWYLVGPFFYLFTLYHFNNPFKWGQLLHFIPFVAFAFLIAPFYLLSGDDKLEILNSIFGKESYQEDINRYIFTAHIFGYVILSFFTFNKESRKLKELSSRSTLVLDRVVSLTLKYYLIFSFLGFVIYLIVGPNYDWSNMYYEFYYLGLSVLIHFIFYYCLHRSNKDEYIETSSFKTEVNKSKKYYSSSLSKGELAEIIQTVSNHVGQFEIYKNPELRLRMVSDELDIPTHHISQAINQELGKTFFDLVNENRIEGIKKNINNEKFKNYTLVGIAFEHGFNSHSSFYRIFKKTTGKTPKEYFQAK